MRRRAVFDHFFTFFFAPNSAASLNMPRDLSSWWKWLSFTSPLDDSTAAHMWRCPILLRPRSRVRNNRHCAAACFWRLLDHNPSRKKHWNWFWNRRVGLAQGVVGCPASCVCCAAFRSDPWPNVCSECLQMDMCHVIVVTLSHPHRSSVPRFSESMQLSCSSTPATPPGNLTTSR